MAPLISATALLASSALLTVGVTVPLDDGAFSLLQVSIDESSSRKVNAAKPEQVGTMDLAMAYLPYNFGHTVAAVAATRGGVQWGDCGQRDAAAARGCLGHMKSNVTGCSLMYTPGKLWPKDLAEAHFGGRTVFGILRDPYERFVAQFRGSGRFLYPDLFAKCDVNMAVRRMMQEYMAEVAAGRPYVENCQRLPQAEFFDAPYGATVFVDNRHFPESMNELYDKHNYPAAFRIQHSEVAHVSGCDHVWAGDLDAETKALVRQVYKRDFELLCEHFGYCDSSENTCITHVQGMCPEQLFSWDGAQQFYVRK